MFPRTIKSIISDSLVLVKALIDHDEILIFRRSRNRWICIFYMHEEIVQESNYSGHVQINENVSMTWLDMQITFDFSIFVSISSDLKAICLFNVSTLRSAHNFTVDKRYLNRLKEFSSQKHD